MTPEKVAAILDKVELPKMQRGSTEAETLRLNNWGVGDILQGVGDGTRTLETNDMILITAIGYEKFLCRWKFNSLGVWRDETGNTTLQCREWKKVGNIYEQKH